MTVLMECTNCGAMVTNPRVINFMYERCGDCVKLAEENLKNWSANV